MSQLFQHMWIQIQRNSVLAATMSSALVLLYGLTLPCGCADRTASRALNERKMYTILYTDADTFEEYALIRLQDDSGMKYNLLYDKSVSFLDSSRVVDSISFGPIFDGSRVPLSLVPIDTPVAANILPNPCTGIDTAFARYLDEEYNEVFWSEGKIIGQVYASPDIIGGMLLARLEDTTNVIATGDLSMFVPAPDSLYKVLGIYDGPLIDYLVIAVLTRHGDKLFLLSPRGHTTNSLFNTEPLKVGWSYRLTIDSIDVPFPARVRKSTISLRDDNVRDVVTVLTSAQEGPVAMKDTIWDRVFRAKELYGRCIVRE